MTSTLLLAHPIKSSEMLYDRSESSGKEAFYSVVIGLLRQSRGTW